MSAEQSPLALAAQRKSESAITRVRTALGAMHDAAVDITFQSVAQQAGVSRQWLYKNAELRAEVEKLRARQQGGRRIPVFAANQRGLASAAQPDAARGERRACDARTASSEKSSPS